MPGGALLNEDRVQFKNTIVADNTATPAGNCAGTGTFGSAGSNLESANTCGLNAGGDLVNIEPHLGPLQNNGGMTLTMALKRGAPP
ncbi:MAG: choice-of-anchor Q domain-containing protein [Solirubrobacteraceae bacterium]